MDSNSGIVYAVFMYCDLKGGQTLITCELYSQLAYFPVPEGGEC